MHTICLDGIRFRPTVLPKNPWRGNVKRCHLHATSKGIFPPAHFAVSPQPPRLRPR
jgi:hypothetical protein